MNLVDVSIDFDFFVKEDLNLGWGHMETVFFLETMWAFRDQGLRFSGQSLREVSPLVEKDFHPRYLVQELDRRGLEIGPDTRLFLSESHASAYKVHKKSGNPLIVLDAHCDIWDRNPELDCANWLGKLIEEKAIPSAVNVFPSWRPRSHGTPNSRWKNRVTRIYWKDLRTEPAEVQNITICRSGCWVPPHHDPVFEEMWHEVFVMNEGDGVFTDEWIVKRRRVDY